MNRTEALRLLETKVKNINLRKHMLATEAIMKKLACRFKKDEELWGLAGLLHDLDYDSTAREPRKHSLVAAAELEKHGLPEEVVYAVKAHNPAHGLARRSELDKALYAVDPLTGLIVAAALIHPARMLSALDPVFILNRYKEKGFARSASREQIASCHELGLSLEEFVAIGLEAMQTAAGELGL